MSVALRPTRTSPLTLTKLNVQWAPSGTVTLPSTFVTVAWPPIRPEQLALLATAWAGRASKPAVTQKASAIKTRVVIEILPLVRGWSHVAARSERAAAHAPAQSISTFRGGLRPLPVRSAEQNALFCLGGSYAQLVFCVNASSKPREQTKEPCDSKARATTRDRGACNNSARPCSPG